MEYKYGIIGFGHLGKAIVKGLLKSGILNEKILTCSKSKETRSFSQSEFGIVSTDDMNYVCKNCNVIFVTLKKTVFDQLPIFDAQNTTIISCMAGVTINELKDIFIKANEIIRAMPMVSISTNEGIIGYTHTDNDDIKNLFDSFGYAFEISETDIEKVTAYSACVLGFAAYLVKSMISAGIALGFDDEISRKIAESNFSAAITCDKYDKIIAEVATKGGATEAGISCMNESNVIDRPIGSVHPKHPDLIYPVNYGYIPDVMGGDGEELDVYLLGVDEVVSEFTCKIIGIIHRENDVEDKLVAAPDGMVFSQAEIAAAVQFQERYYKTKVEVYI